MLWLLLAPLGIDCAAAQSIRNALLKSSFAGIPYKIRTRSTRKIGFGQKLNNDIYDSFSTVSSRLGKLGVRLVQKGTYARP
jgi:hypothetical protein